MRGAAAYARAVLRRRWRSWLGFVVFLALAGGSVMALVAGARRTASAYPRFLRTQHAADAAVYLGGPRLKPADVQRLPQVTASAVELGPASTQTDFIPAVFFRHQGDDVNRFKLLSGRPVRADRSDEVVVGFDVARRRHLHLGSRLPIQFLPSTDGPPVAVVFKVVGIEAMPGEFPPRLSSGADFVQLSPAFLGTTIGSRSTSDPEYVVLVRLRHGAADEQALKSELYQLAKGPVGVTLMADQTSNVERSLHYQVVALQLLAGLAGLTLALILVQLLLREASFQAEDHPSLRALGMTTGQLLASGMLRVMVATVAGVVGAVAVAIGLSPLLPIGTARIAEPHPGFAVDVTALAVGALVMVAAVGLLAVACLWRVTRLAEFTDVSSTTGPTKLATLVQLPITAAVGIRLALQPGRGRTATPVRTTLTAVAIATGATIGAVTFAACLSHLLSTPRLYGATFDAEVESNGNFGDVRPFVPVLKDDPNIDAIALGSTGAPFKSGRVSFGAQYETQIRGTIDPPLLSGRMPSASDEIAFGSRTLASLHAHLGSTVPVVLSGLTQSVPAHVVGVVVLPASNDTEQLGRGAVVTPEFLSVLKLPAGFRPPPPGDIFVRFRSGVNVAQELARLQTQAPSSAVLYRPVQPNGVVNFGQVRNLPTILAGLLAVVAGATIAHLLASAVRRRRRDLALLKILGLTPRGVAAVVAWQATTITVIALAVSVPVGIAVGRVSWDAVASHLGAVVEPSTPLALVLGLIPASVLLANVIAAVPAFSAGRIKPAIALRSE